jgi:peptide/nickel transport system permease protein
MVGVVVLAIFIGLAIFGPLLIAEDPQAKVGDVFEPPSREFRLGTDGGGASMVDLLIAGTRVSLLIGFCAAAISALIGGTVGIVSGFFGGKTDTALMRITDYFLVIPDVPLMIVIAALFGRSTWNIILIIGIIYWTFTARLIRAQTKSVRERVYVQRARALGAGNTRLIVRHVLPQVTPLLVANTVLLIAYAIFAETFITFLGLGDPSTISWGRLIENAFTDDAIINEAWWAVIPPGLCVMFVVLSCTIIGQAMEDALNPRLRTGHLSVRRFRVLPRAPKPESPGS